MEYLEDSIKRKGITYTAIKTTETYRIWKSDIAKEVYEVHLRKFSEAKEYTPEGATDPIKFAAKEQFPSDESFGKWAWTFRSIQECEDKIKLELEVVAERELQNRIKDLPEYPETLERFKAEFKATKSKKSPIEASINHLRALVS